MTKKYEYNKANLITGVTNTNNKNVKTSYRYSYYPDGNIAHYVNHYNATMDYTYDSVNRVVKEVYGEDAGTPFTIDYIYDEFGNLSKKNYGDEDSPAYITTYSYDKNNRLTKESQVINDVSAKWQNITTYGYDKNGNRLNRVEYKNKNVDSNKFNLGMIDVGSNSKGTGYKYSDYGKEVYTYDGLNELKSYRGKNEQNATYEYMPNHYRISKTVDGTKTYQLWDNDRVVSEFDSELNLKINYRIGVNGQVLSDSKENLYSYDGHGNLVNAKSSYSTCVYDAYGNKTEDFGTGDAPFGYCGEYTDKESGLVYLRNRYYDPSTGSFITEDPIKDGNNWYGYCEGNPVNAWDPLGLKNYIINGPDQRETQELNAKDMELSSVDYQRYSVSNVTELYNAWEEISKNITCNDDLIINMHGTPDELSVMENGGIIELSRLSSITANSIQLFVCNSGHMDYSNNLAVQMLNNNNVNYVVAPDGTNKRESDTKRNGEKTADGAEKSDVIYSKEMSVVGDDKFLEYRNEDSVISDRQSQGYIEYYKKKDGIARVPVVSEGQLVTDLSLTKRSRSVYSARD